MKTKRDRQKKVASLPINRQHWWLSEYGSYSRSDAIDHSASDCAVERDSVEDVLDARTVFLAAMKMETPYAPRGSHSYAQLRQLTEEFVDDALVEEGILRFPILADFVAERTGLSMGIVLRVLAADARYTHECSGSSVVLGLADWADPQIRAGRAAFDEFNRTSARMQAGKALDDYALSASPQAARPVAATRTWPTAGTDDAVDASTPPIIRMQHLVLVAYSKLADLECLIAQNASGFNLPGVLSELTGMRDNLGCLSNELWQVMMREDALCWCEPDAASPATCDAQSTR